jgi:hypothetical protein
VRYPTWWLCSVRAAVLALNWHRGAAEPATLVHLRAETIASSHWWVWGYLLAHGTSECGALVVGARVRRSPHELLPIFAPAVPVVNHVLLAPSPRTRSLVSTPPAAIQGWKQVANRNAKGFGTGQQKMALERGTTPKLSRRACSPRCGLHSCRGKSAGVAKPAAISHPKPLTRRFATLSPLYVTAPLSQLPNSVMAKHAGGVGFRIKRAGTLHPTAFIPSLHCLSLALTVSVGSSRVALASPRKWFRVWSSPAMRSAWVVVVAGAAPAASCFTQPTARTHVRLRSPLPGAELFVSASTA